MRLIDADHLRKWIIANWGSGWHSKTVDDILTQIEYREFTWVCNQEGGRRMIKARITNLEKGNSIAYEGEIVKMDKRFGTTYDIEIRVNQHLHCIFDDIDEKDITIIQNEGMVICNMNEVEKDEIDRR